MTPRKSFKSLTVYYDGDCPFCTNYAKYQSLSAVTERLELRNLREESNSFMNFLLQKRIDPEKGMVLKVEHQDPRPEEWLSGKNAVKFLGTLEERASPMALAHRLLALPFISDFIYPILLIGRRITLMFLMRSRRLIKQKSNCTY